MATPERNKRPPFNAPDSTSKKMRQTTLSFSPDPTKSPYFAKRRPRDDTKPSDDESQASTSQTSAPSQDSTVTDSQATTEYDSQLTDSQLTNSQETSQLIYTTPPWSRSVRKLDMAANALKHTGAQYKEALALVAAATLSATPRILSTTSASENSTLYVGDNLRLGYAFNPRLPPVRISVSPLDTYEAAIFLLATDPSRGVCVLNMANARLQGGGWLEGATAQEEQLCYRSTLIRTLKPNYYPWPSIAAVWSPRVAIFRNQGPGYEMYEESMREVEIVGVVSAAAIQCKEVKETYEKEWQRKTMREKMRLILRVCGREKQKRIVLGAFGCGAFKNPNREVAMLWRELLEDREFRGWWEEVVFAVYVPEGIEPMDEPNYKVFKEILDGVMV